MSFPARRRLDHEPDDTNALRALVCDDHAEFRQYMATLVGRFGFNVTLCCDGVDAMEAIQERTYDLVLIDCEMPRRGGLEIIGEIRTSETNGDTYAVMLTGREDVATKLAALRLGYDDFIPKSAGELEIAAKLSAARRLVSRHRRLDTAVRELYGLATRDELTGLFNRRHFFTEAERLLAEATSVNLVLLDLDDFKKVNDTLGHMAGDRILRDIGALFLRRTRHEDVVARYGGDEFVMLVTSLLPPEVEKLAERLANEIASLQWTFGPETFGVGVTTGFACSTLLDAPSVPKLLSACDRDLYKNKWLRKHPGEDARLYEYDRERESMVIELVEENQKPDTRHQKADTRPDTRHQTPDTRNQNRS